MLERPQSPFSALGRRAAGLFKRAPRNGNGANGRSDLDRRLVFSLAKSRVPSWAQLRQVGRFLTKGERWAIRAALALIILSSGYVVGGFYLRNLREVPLPGAVYAEGLIGSPKNINPLYALVNDADSDLASLVYSPLFRRDGRGKLAPDLAETITSSGDGKEYTVRLKGNAQWHDGGPVDANDVIFTFLAIKDPLYKSPLRNGFGGVTGEVVDERTVRFKLADPYAAFPELLTFGILPSKHWSQIPPEAAVLAELNLKPIGSGPFKFSQLAKDKTGFIREYELVPHAGHHGPVPFLGIKFVFYAGFEEAIAALNNNTVDGLSYLPVQFRDSVLTPKSYHYYAMNMPQLTAVFLNQSRNEALKDKGVRQALAYALDRQRIVDEVMKGAAALADGPIPPNSFAYDPDIKSYGHDPAKAAELLDAAGWVRTTVDAAMLEQAALDSASEDAAKAEAAGRLLALGEGSWRRKDGQWLVLDLKTVDRGENAQALEMIRADWEAAGAKTLAQALPLARVQGEVVKGRQFDAFFYGQVSGADPDPYAFWHSSQTGEGGFNIAGFANKEADQLMEDARLIMDQDGRRQKYLRFQEIVAEEEPAIFVYSPVYTYVQANKVKGFDVTDIVVPRDRLANVAEWYIKTGKRLVWPE